jgi:hypothetical protein
MTSSFTSPRDRARHFLHTLVTTRDSEVDCEAVMQVIARYVEVEARGDCPSVVADGLPLHFQHCPHCAEMYRALLHLAELEAGGRLPDLDELWVDLRNAVATPAGAP